MDVYESLWPNLNLVALLLQDDSKKKRDSSRWPGGSKANVTEASGSLTKASVDSSTKEVRINLVRIKKSFLNKDIKAKYQFCEDSEDEDAPDPAEMRRQMSEAAEKRQKEAEGRGLKDPEGAKRRIEAKEKAAREMEQGGGGPSGGMKWQVD